MDLFSNFTTTSYIFLTLGTGGTRGNSIVSQTSAQGIFKLRNGLTATGNTENVVSTASLHIKPSEAFISALNGKLVGQGVRVDGNDYRIVGLTAGKGGLNFDVVEHYTLTLQREDLV